MFIYGYGLIQRTAGDDVFVMRTVAVQKYFFFGDLCRLNGEKSGRLRIRVGRSLG